MVRVIEVNDAGNDFEPIPVGTRIKVAVYEIEEGVTGPSSQKPGSPQFVYTAKVTEEGQYFGREIRYNNVPLDPNATNSWVLSAFADAVGWPNKVLPNGKKQYEIPDDLNDVVGTEFTAKMGQQTSQKLDADGKPYINNRVNGTYRLKAGGTTPKAEKPKWGDL